MTLLKPTGHQPQGNFIQLVCAITYLSEELGFLFPDFSVIPSTPPHLLSYPLGSPVEGFGTVSSQLLTRWLHIL